MKSFSNNLSGTFSSIPMSLIFYMGAQALYDFNRENWDYKFTSDKFLKF